jgi:hypothetical protein
MIELLPTAVDLHQLVARAASVGGSLALGRVPRPSPSSDRRGTSRSDEDVSPTRPGLIPFFRPPVHVRFEPEAARSCDRAIALIFTATRTEGSPAKRAGAGSDGTPSGRDDHLGASGAAKEAGAIDCVLSLGVISTSLVSPSKAGGTR